jgi:hypothetical protein
MATPSSTAETSGPATDPPHHQESASQAWRQVAVQLGQIRAFAGHFLEAKMDAIRLSIRQMVIFAALGIVGLVALSAIAVMMVVFLFQGIAGGFAELFNGRLWLGELVTMGIFALALTAAVSMSLGAIRNASRRRTVEKYESRQSQQRVSFGTDVHEQATRT